MKRILSLILCTVLLMCICAPMVSAVESNTREKVRVGWFESTYFTTGEDGRKTGYAYDYLQRISAYTGWEYEYVEGSWYELSVMLENGEIDILADVTQTEARLDTMLFSAVPMGGEEFYIFVSGNNKDISASDYTTLNGKQIIVMNGSRQSSLLNEWVTANGITPEIISGTASEQEYLQQLQSGEVDAVVSVTAFELLSEEIYPIFEIGNSNMYFAINKNRSDLKQSIDVAMSKILNNDRNFNNSLYEKYFANTGNINYVSTEESEWLSEHDVIKIGYRDNYMPFCKKDVDGSTVGFLKDFVDYIETEKILGGLKFELVAYDSSEDALLAMKNGEVDCVFPMAQAPYDAELGDFSITSSVVSSEMYIIVRSSDENISAKNNLRVAINEGNPDYEVTVERFFPNWDIVYFATSEDGLKGIKNNEADCLLVSNYRLNALSETMEKYDLTAISTDEAMNISFATAKDNTVLYSIMDKVASSIPEDTANIMFTNNAYEAQRVTVFQFIKDNLVLSLSFILAIFAAILTTIFLRIYHNKKEIFNKKLQVTNEELVKASEAKTEFLFNMSHDLRTPMNAILGFNNMAIRDIDEKEKVLDSLHKSQVSGQALLSIINDILDSSRLESGKVEVNTVKANVEKCFTESEVVLRSLANYNNVKIDFIVYDMEHKYAYVDVIHIDRIFFNVISNAIKYTPAGGSVTVEAKEIPSEKPGYGRYQFIVSDTGIGMSKKFQEEMFKPFTREENSTTSGIAGTGLGLSLVKSFVDLLEGTIECKSELGKGTTMSIEFDFKLQEGKGSDFARESTDKIDNAISLPGKTVLLVEDNELNREIAMDILFECEANVISANNGQEALDRLEQYGIDKFDFVLMDIQMPIMDGYEATKEIRRKYKDFHIPIIAVSANAFEQDKKKSISMGMDAHIAKPIDVDELLGTINEILK